MIIGIITNAQNANMKNGMAVLEEFLQQKYVENYDKFNNDEVKVMQLQKLYPEYFYIPSAEGVGSLKYIVDSKGHALYLLKKSGLPKEIRTQLVGGNAGNGTYSDYATLNDVYGVTSDLKVYYSAASGEELFGITDNLLDNDNPRRDVFANSGTTSALYNLMSNYDLDEDGIISAEEIKSVDKLTITATSGITNLTELYNLTSLQELTLNNVSLSSLSGIENITNLKYLHFLNYSSDEVKILDYSKLKNLNKLVHLYLENTTDLQVKSVFESMQNVDYPKLQYLGIINSSTRVTDVSSMRLLNELTQSKIENLYLYSTSIESISFLKNTKFNINKLLVNNSKLKSFDGIEKMSKLIYIEAQNCELGREEIYDTTLENDGKNPEKDALAACASLNNLDYILLNKNPIKWCDYLVSCRLNVNVNFEGCDNLVRESVKKLKDKYLALKPKGGEYFIIPDKYLSLFNTNERLDYYNADLTNNSQEFKDLYDDKDILYLRLDGNTELTDDVSDTSLHTLSETLGTCTSLKVLSLRKISGITNLSFVENLPNLEEIDLIGCSNLNDLSALEENCPNLISLRVNNVSIDLTKIQGIISRCTSQSAGSFSGSSWAYGGFYCTSVNLAEKLNLCTSITTLYLNGLENNGDCIDLSGMTSLEKFLKETGNGAFKFPSSLKKLYLYRQACYKVSDLSLCSSLELINLSPEANVYTFDSWVSQIANCTNLETLNFVRTIKFYCSNMDLLEACTNLSVLKITTNGGTTIPSSEVFNLQNISSLTSIQIENLSNLKSIGSDLSQLTLLTSLILSNCAVIDISPFSSLTSLTKLTLNNNKVTSIKALENLKKLSDLDLSNNLIYDSSSYVDQSGNIITYDNLPILARLNPNYIFSEEEIVAGYSGKGNLTRLCLAGNSGIINFTPVSTLKWPDGKTGF